MPTRQSRARAASPAPRPASAPLAIPPTRLLGRNRSEACRLCDHKNGVRDPNVIHPPGFLEQLSYLEPQALTQHLPEQSIPYCPQARGAKQLLVQRIRLHSARNFFRRGSHGAHLASNTVMLGERALPGSIAHIEIQLLPYSSKRSMCMATIASEAAQFTSPPVGHGPRFSRFPVGPTSGL